jgi:dipeptidase E
MNPGRIYLGGGGDPQQAFEVERDFFATLGADARILYVPIALRRNGVGYESCYDWFASVVASHAQGRDLDFTMLLEGDPAPDLAAFDGVYVGGGNTYRLIKYMHDSGFGNRIAGFVSGGGTYFGGSAGAMVLGADIRTVEEENDQGYLDNSGFNLLGGRSVLCHFSEGQEQRAIQMAVSIGTEVIAIPEDSGVVYESGRAPRVIGRAYTFNAQGPTTL